MNSQCQWLQKRFIENHDPEDTIITTDLIDRDHERQSECMLSEFEVTKERVFNRCAFKLPPPSFFMVYGVVKDMTLICGGFICALDMTAGYDIYRYL